MTIKILEKTSENASNRCFCCDGQLIQQVRSNKVRWYCLNCRQEMPNFCSLSDREQTKAAQANSEVSSEANTQANTGGGEILTGDPALAAVAPVPMTSARATSAPKTSTSTAETSESKQPVSLP
ncbi:MAG: hypothetical protein AAFQ40_04450 [Cyanobacteria bacterium J06623_5]